MNIVIAIDDIGLFAQYHDCLEVNDVKRFPVYTDVKSIKCCDSNKRSIVRKHGATHILYGEVIK